jgi:CubicO group peptidase (beta-lactamase class C family)
MKRRKDGTTERRTAIPQWGLVSLVLGVLSVVPSFRPSVALAAQTAYTPPRGDAWETRDPRAANFDPVQLSAAVDFAKSNPIPWSRDLTEQMKSLSARERWPLTLGPVKNWDAPSGVVLRHGYIIAEWGDTRRVDVTFSVAKSYLSAVTGLAVDRGMIPDVDRPVGDLVKDGGFESEHNRAVTWRHLLTQTSEWEGVLWGKPDSADRRAGWNRALQAPGTFWEYNDVRVNRLALSLLRVWQRPLPEVLGEFIMKPIGATDTWRWYGYFNSWVMESGRLVQSVSGGTHWGGGIWMNTRDHARFGLLMSRNGMWGDTRLLSDKWVSQIRTPTPLRPVYGWLWWLNTERKQFPAASERSFFALGAGGNMIWIDPDLDLVVVTRWLDPAKTNDFIGKVIAAFAGT